MFWVATVSIFVRVSAKIGIFVKFLNRFSLRLSRGVFLHSLAFMSIAISHSHFFKWNPRNALLLKTNHLCGMMKNNLGLKNGVMSFTLHEVCNAFFSVTLPLVHFKSTFSSLNALLARETTFCGNRRCKWDSCDLIIATKHFRRLWIISGSVRCERS